jgi:hypothetical protein
MEELTIKDYPYFKNKDQGIKVVVSKGASLPGLFLTTLDAERAYEKYKNRKVILKKSSGNKAK